MYFLLVLARLPGQEKGIINNSWRERFRRDDIVLQNDGGWWNSLTYFVHGLRYMQGSAY